MFRISSLASGFWDALSAILASIPKTLYFLITSCSSFLDLLQSLFRKVIGLDSYYTSGKLVDVTNSSSDFIYEFVRGTILNEEGAYPAIRATFIAMLALGLILLFICTLIAVAKNNYYPGKDTPSTGKTLGGAIKALFAMVMTPVVLIVATYLGNIFLRAIDASTSVGGTTSITLTQAFEENEMGTYSNYDLFGYASPSNTTTMSGLIFKVCTYSANRVRPKTQNQETDFGKDYATNNYGVALRLLGSSAQASIFDPTAISPTTNTSLRVEEVASMVDNAFASNAILKEEYRGRVPYCKTDALGTTTAESIGSAFDPLSFWHLAEVESFSKYNVALVWHFYDLWQYNFIMAVVFIAIFGVQLLKITGGMINRLIKSMFLLLIYAPLLGVSPLKGKAFDEGFKGPFISNYLSAFSAVAGMNIFFIVVPILQTITFFDPLNQAYILPNMIIQLVFMAVALTFVKEIIKMVGSAIGAGESSISDDQIKDVKKNLTTGTKAVAGALAMTPVAVGARLAGKGATAIANAHEKRVAKKSEASARSAAANELTAGKNVTSNMEWDSVKSDYMGTDAVAGKSNDQIYQDTVEKEYQAAQQAGDTRSRADFEAQETLAGGRLADAAFYKSYTPISSADAVTQRESLAKGLYDSTNRNAIAGSVYTQAPKGRDYEYQNAGKVKRAAMRAGSTINKVALAPNAILKGYKKRYEDEQAAARQHNRAFNIANTFRTGIVRGAATMFDATLGGVFSTMDPRSGDKK